MTKNKTKSLNVMLIRTIEMMMIIIEIDQKLDEHCKHIHISTHTHTHNITFLFTFNKIDRRSREIFFSHSLRLLLFLLSRDFHCISQTQKKKTQREKESLPFTKLAFSFSSSILGCFGVYLRSQPLPLESNIELTNIIHVSTTRLSFLIVLKICTFCAVFSWSLL